MSPLPEHGRVNCTECYDVRQVEFDRTKQKDGSWRITANPLAWGNPRAEIVVLGFSKGPSQAGVLARTPHDEVAFKKGRLNVGKILSYVGLLERTDDAALVKAVDAAIADRTGRFHFGSLIRCTVEHYDSSKKEWKGSGGGMLDRFVATGFGHRVAQRCTAEFLGDLPLETNLIMMFGLGNRQNYVREAYNLFQEARHGDWRWLNEVSYTDGAITVVHVEHFASQGDLVKYWLGEKDHDRSRFGRMAKDAVAQAIRVA